MAKKEQVYHRSFQIQIKPGHKLYDYFVQNCMNAKNLYNATNFHIRQIYSAYKSPRPLHALQQEVLDHVDEFFPSMNEVQRKAHEKRLLKQQEKMQKGESVKKPSTLNLFVKPNKEKSFVDYNFLDAYFKASKNVDYKSLSAHTAQAMMKKAYDAWKSFFEANKRYNTSEENKEKFSGRPKIPGYKKQDMTTTYFSNQECVIKDGKYLKFPKTKTHLNIGKLGVLSDGQKLVEVRVNPYAAIFIVEVVFAYKEKNETPQDYIDGGNTLSIDFGLNNFAACVFSEGQTPFIINGRGLKSVNFYYYKKRQHLVSTLRIGKKDQSGQHTSKRLQRLDLKRRNKTRDFYHKASKEIIERCLQNDVKNIIVGKNVGWKKNASMGKSSNRDFCHVSHAMFVDILKYKAEQKGIFFAEVEESFTSKASFIDKDFLPVHVPGEKNKHTFSGTRVKRGLYIAKNGTKLNADVNAAYNIMRKLSSRNFEGVEACVTQPQKIGL